MFKYEEFLFKSFISVYLAKQKAKLLYQYYQKLITFYFGSTLTLLKSFR